MPPCPPWGGHGGTAPVTTPARYTHFWADADWAVLWPYYCSPFPWSLARSKAELDRSVQHAAPTTGRASVDRALHRRYLDYEGRDFAAFAVDWGEMPGVIGNSDVTQSRGPVDFRLWHYRRWVREGGFRGLYIDENYLGFDRNPLTGGAYLWPDGRVQPGYTYTGLREYFKRMMVMFHQEGRPRPNLWQHISSGAAYHAWYGDILMEGENVEPTNEEADYLEVLPASRMRAIGSPICNGSTTIMMCQSQRHATTWEPKHTHQFVGWILAHDIMPEQVRWFGALAQAGRLHRDDVQFVGYWKPDNPVRTATPDCVASLHRSGDRALVWIVNAARQERTAGVSVDWQSLGLDRARTEALNAETGEPVRWPDRGSRCPCCGATLWRCSSWNVVNWAPASLLSATFDGGAEADQAFGCEMLVGDGQLVSSDRGRAGSGGKGRPAVEPSQPPRRGRPAYVPRKTGRRRVRHAPAYRNTAGRHRRPAAGAACGRRTQKDRRGHSTRAPAGRPARAERPSPAVSMTLPTAAGWHEFDLSWKDKRLALAVDGKPVGTIPVRSLNIPSATGPQILGMARFVLGGRGPVQAIDDVRTWR